ncbi:MAG TPA: hypothetical protein VJU86_05815 [Pyrinomonadaceae bacterium]|nr:hypothetical protein [Pyrinomonadaceae bacterium]
MRKQLPVLTPSPLPSLYAAWIDQLLAGPIPPETDATCNDCAMLPKDGDDLKSTVFFNPQTKCCTYIPTIPNYLVGRMLEDEDPGQAAGRTTIENRIRSGVGVTPLGLSQPTDFRILYRSSSDSLFGQSRTLLCPHYLDNEGGRCGVWKNRAALCATWHCKYVRGIVGQKFWTALHKLLTAVEDSLSQWCVFELDVGSDALRQLFPTGSRFKKSEAIEARALDGTSDLSDRRALWGRWAGREKEFYLKCAGLVNELNWQDVVAIDSAELRIYAHLLVDAYHQLLSEQLPDRLKVGTHQLIDMDHDSYRVSPYNPYDPISLPIELMTVLGYFDGRPTSEALDAILEFENVRLEPALIRKLTDFGVLVAAQPD